MANYATVRLLEAEKGEEARDAFLLWLEERYLAERRIDREKSLRESTLDSPDAESVVYNKGALVLWKMHQLLGEDRMDAALQDFVGQYAIHTGKRPDLQDFLDVVRSHVDDKGRFDAFVEEWIESVGGEGLSKSASLPVQNSETECHKRSESYVTQYGGGTASSSSLIFSVRSTMLALIPHQSRSSLKPL